MRDITIRLIGLAGFAGILFTWYLWAQFLLSLANATPIGVVVGLVGIGFWFIGEVVLSLIGGAICGAMLFTS